MKRMSLVKESWNSRLGIIFAVAGSAVGLGNFLRFPGLAAQYGGGAFMIAYFVSLLFIGVPVSLAEWTVGRQGGGLGFHSSPGIFHALIQRRWAKYLGTIGLFVPLTVVMYYMYVEAWCMGYAFNACTGRLSATGPEGFAGFFKDFTGISANGGAIGFGTDKVGMFVLIVFVVNFFLIYRGVSRGIERMCRVGMPLLILLAVVILVRVFTLGTPNAAYPDRNVLAALGHMWNPGDVLGQLNNPQLWLAAAGQIFFSLTIGMGAVITYSSYLRKTDDVTLSSLTAVSANEFCEVALGGMTTVPAIFLFLGASGVVGQTFSLGFIALPEVFANMVAGPVFATAFFLLLLLAAVTSSISLLQPCIAFIEEAFRVPRRISISWLCGVCALGTSWVWYFSKDLKALDTMDFWVGNVGVFLQGTLIIVIFGWIVGIEKSWSAMHQGAALRVPSVFRFIMKYLTPTYLIAIFIMFLLQNVAGWNFSFVRPDFRPTGYITDLFGETASDVARLTASFMALTLLAGLFLVRIARRRWETDGHH
ncbi:MAG: sodium-dependent transporter [Puniceicoccales bacterium]|jgi:SNF family Na+-dependent transporter|nr:sodium-dependent transporter [Puniceicoccales bacterium]